MRDTLYEGEWLVALDKGVAMVNSCERLDKGARAERIILKYFNNLFKMTPFDLKVTQDQIRIKLESSTELWVNHLGIVSHYSRIGYGRVR